MMEFEDEHEEEEEEEREENNNNNNNHEDDDDDDDDEDEDGDEEPINLSLPYKFELKKHHPHPPSAAARYRECLKNHAVTIGGHAVDGCGEFMPAGPDATLDALKCAACNCHRNFHRKELLFDSTSNNNQLTVFTPRPNTYLHSPAPPLPAHAYPFFRGPTTIVTPPPPQIRPLALPSTGGDNAAAEENVIGGMATMTMTSTSSGKKRFRTKFTPEQKDKMLGFAERVGWRIQKQDEGLVQEFCSETGIKRHVLKVWMHNNKHTLGKKP